MIGYGFIQEGRVSVDRVAASQGARRRPAVCLHLYSSGAMAAQISRWTALKWSGGGRHTFPQDVAVTGQAYEYDWPFEIGSYIVH